MYDGGADVVGYVVEVLEEGSEQWYRATQKTLKTNLFVAAGLQSNKKYSFRVAGVNSNGTGEFSEPSVEIEPVEKLCKFVFMLLLSILHNGSISNVNGNLVQLPFIPMSTLKPSHSFTLLQFLYICC